LRQGRQGLSARTPIQSGRLRLCLAAVRTFATRVGGFVNFRRMMGVRIQARP